MAYLNANIPVTYAQIRGNTFMTLKNTMEKVEDCIIFAMASITGRPYCFMQLWKMVLSSIVSSDFCLYPARI